MAAAEAQVAARALAAVVGAQVADAAAVASHWIYDPAKMEAALAAKKRGPAFLDPPGNVFYKAPASGQSCYGDQAFALLSSLSPCGKFDVDDFTARLAQAFGRESEYELPGFTDPEDWPNLVKGVVLPVPGPWRHGSIKHFLRRYVTEGKRYPDCGAPDESLSIDFVCKIVPLVALYAGNSELPKFTEMAIRTTQNTDGAVKYGIAFARCLELLILGREQTPAAAVAAVLASLKAEEPGSDVAPHLEAVLAEFTDLSLPALAARLKPAASPNPFTGLA
mmetsp:Transcript_54437/g.158918  ORF Transcript_54437/g.158918 Transcript_54437/m.158918 type:complete len:278 (+) Transcript_54437:34-867(+)